MTLFLATGCSEPTDPAREESSTNPQLNDAPAEAEEAQGDVDNSASNESPVSLDGLLPKQLAPLTVSWTGDLDGMAERRVVRALVVPGGPQFFYYRGKPRGAIAELLVLLQKELNENLGRGLDQIEILPMPVSRDRLIPWLPST